MIYVYTVLTDMFEASTSSAQTDTEKSSILSSIPSISKGPDWSGEAMHEEIQQGRSSCVHPVDQSSEQNNTTFQNFLGETRLMCCVRFMLKHILVVRCFV